MSITHTRRHFSVSSLVLSAFVLAGLTFALPAFTPEAKAACNASPEGKVLVVSDNVYETDGADARKPGDMKRFVDRMTEMVPSAPDVVLVQEVRKVAVNNIRSYLANRFGCSFSIPVNASKSAWRWKSNNKIIGQDTAVILNTDTMRLRSKGFVTNSYKPSQAAKGEPVKVKKAAWTKIVEKDLVAGAGDGLITMAAASGHYPRAQHFRSYDLAKRLTVRFSKRIANKLERVLPDDSRSDSKMHVLAGDFNMHRYENSVTNPTPMYKTLTSSPYSFKDGVIKLTPGIRNPNPIDFLFSSGNAARAEADRDNTHNESSPNFYSNHDLRWAMLEGPDRTAPTRPGNIEKKQGFRSFTRIWGWDPSKDGGTGFDGYVVYRKRASDSDWEVVKRGLMNTDFTDESVTNGVTYEYKVTALDEAGNESDSSSPLEIKAGD